MVEWFKAAVLKTAVGQLTEGSNPSLSAIFMLKSRIFPRFFPVRLVKLSFVCYIVP